MTDKELKELKDTLWHSADVLRASAHLAANKYGQPILGLIFLRYADILYKQHKEEIEAEYNRLKDGRMEKSIKEISIEKCGFYLPECAYYDFINPTIEEDKIKEIVKTLRQDYTGTDIVDTNYKLYRQMRNNIRITVRRNGNEDFDFVKLLDFEHPENNTFTAVSQMWIQGKVYYRRPDEIESELEKFRCQIYKAKYVPVKASPISGMMRYFGEDSETKGTDE